jgi:hypothetical protein
LPQEKFPAKPLLPLASAPYTEPNRRIRESAIPAITFSPPASSFRRRCARSTARRLRSPTDVRQFDGCEPRTKHSQPRIIIETHQPKILWTAQSHSFRGLQQAHGHQVIRHINSIGLMGERRTTRHRHLQPGSTATERKAALRTEADGTSQADLA